MNNISCSARTPDVRSLNWDTGTEAVTLKHSGSFVNVEISTTAVIPENIKRSKLSY